MRRGAEGGILESGLSTTNTTNAAVTTGATNCKDKAFHVSRALRLNRN